MAAGVFCRENLIVMVGFNVLYALRTERDRTSRALALVLQTIPIGLFILSRLKPVFAPLAEGFDATPDLTFARSFVFSPDRQARVFYAHLNALGVLAILAAVQGRRVAAFVSCRLEWAFYMVATFLMLIAGGTDLDRFAYWQAPLLLAVVAGTGWPRPEDGWFWVHIVLLHAVSMSFPLWWDPAEPFYLALTAAHARNVPFGYLAATCLSMAILTLTMTLRNTSIRRSRSASY